MSGSCFFNDIVNILTAAAIRSEDLVLDENLEGLDYKAIIKKILDAKRGLLFRDSAITGELVNLVADHLEKVCEISKNFKPPQDRAMIVNLEAVHELLVKALVNPIDTYYNFYMLKFIYDFLIIANDMFGKEVTWLTINLGFNEIIAAQITENLSDLLMASLLNKG